MLVKLYTLPDLKPELDAMVALGITIRRPLPPERTTVTDWVFKTFHNRLWMDEAAVTFSAKPVSCFIALRGRELLGFACYEATARNFFGPTGVTEAARGKGIGKALLLAALHAMCELGYAYAIIGGVGPAEFYEKTIGATIIEGSTTSIFGDLL